MNENKQIKDDVLDSVSGGMIPAVQIGPADTSNMTTTQYTGQTDGGQVLLGGKGNTERFSGGQTNLLSC